MREIVVFVNLRPEPEPDQQPIEAEAAREAGPTDTPAPLAAETAGKLLNQLAALEENTPAETPAPERAGDPEAL